MQLGREGGMPQTYAVPVAIFHARQDTDFGNRFGLREYILISMQNWLRRSVAVNSFILQYIYHPNQLC